MALLWSYMMSSPIVIRGQREASWHPTHNDNVCGNPHSPFPPFDPDLTSLYELYDDDGDGDPGRGRSIHQL